MNWTENPRVGSLCALQRRINVRRIRSPEAINILSFGTIIKSTGEIIPELLFFWMNFMKTYVLNDQSNINKLIILRVE